jgi:hypothetical protein
MRPCVFSRFASLLLVGLSSASPSFLHGWHAMRARPLPRAFAAGALVGPGIGDRCAHVGIACRRRATCPSAWGSASTSSGRGSRVENEPEKQAKRSDARWKPSSHRVRRLVLAHSMIHDEIYYDTSTLSNKLSDHCPLPSSDRPKPLSRDAGSHPRPQAARLARVRFVASRLLGAVV